MFRMRSNPGEPLPVITKNEIALMTKDEFIHYQNPHGKFHPDEAYDNDLATLNQNYKLRYVYSATSRPWGDEEFLVYKTDDDFLILARERRSAGDDKLAAIIIDGVLHYDNPHLYDKMPQGYQETPGGKWIPFEPKQIKRVKYLSEIRPQIDNTKQRNLANYPYVYRDFQLQGQNYQIRSREAPVLNKGTCMVIMNENGEIVAHASDEWGATLLRVAQEYRGRGLGKILGSVWMQWNPEYESGGFTRAGLQSAIAIWQARVREFLENQWYGILIRHGLLTVARLREITAGLTPKRPITAHSDVGEPKDKDILIYVERDEEMWGPAFVVYDRAFFQEEDEKYIYGFGFFRESTPGIFLYTIDYDREFQKLTTYVALQIARNNKEDIYIGPGYGDMLELDNIENIEIDGDYVVLTQDVLDLDKIGRLERLIRKQNDEYNQKYYQLIEMAHVKWQ